MRKRKNLFLLSTRACLTMLLMLFAVSAFAQNIVVKGSVKDATGVPVIGANVRQQGASSGVITDMNGYYSINCSAKAVLEFSYIGYATQKVQVNGQKNYQCSTD